MRWRKPSYGPQTLIQPDVQHPVTLPGGIPVPQVAIWQPSAVPVKKIVPALPQKLTPSEVKPSVESPNEELAIADVKISSTFHPTPKPIVAASTTSPVAIKASTATAGAAVHNFANCQAAHAARCTAISVKPAYEGRRRYPASGERECGGQIPGIVDRAIEGRCVCW